LVGFGVRRFFLACADYAFEAIAGDGLKVTNTATGAPDWIYTVDTFKFADGTFAASELLV
jgi:hypothetical protein